MAISLVARGLIDLKPLVTHRFKFEEAVKAFGVTQNGKDEDGKVSSPLSWAGAIDMTRTSG
jgi:D-xylulose reductase